MSELVIGRSIGDCLQIDYQLDKSITGYLPLRPNPSTQNPVIPIQGVGDMFRAMYDHDGNGIVDHVDEVAISEVTGLQDALDNLVSPGNKNVITRKAATVLSALRLVSEGVVGVYELDPMIDVDAMGMLGITVVSGSPGEDITIQVGGTIQDSSWSWNKGFVFAGPNGTLTQTAPQSGWEIVVGYSPIPTQINLQFDEPLLLA